MHGADRNRPLALAIGKPLRAGQRADLFQGIAASRIPLEQTGDDRSLIGIDGNALLAVRRDNVPVSERRRARPQALLGLLQHPLADFLGEIVDVVFRHQHLDAVHELFGGSGFPRKGDALLHQMDFGIKLVDRHPVLEVAIQAVGLLHEDGLHGLVLAEVADHLVEVCAPALLGRLHVDIFARDIEPVGLGVVAQQFELGRDREAFALLLAGRHPRIDHRLGGLKLLRLLPRPRPCRLRHAKTSWASVALPRLPPLPPGKAIRRRSRWMLRGLSRSIARRW
jgi:hypothetical protein